MRMTPVHAKPSSRLMWAKMLTWDIWLRMKALHGDLDVWLPEWATTAPDVDSPWGQTLAYESGLAPLEVGRVIHVVKAEGSERLHTTHDFFAVLRSAVRSRSVYALYVLCRATIEACAFASWVFDPRAEAAERLLRGLLLRKQAMCRHTRSLRQQANDPANKSDAAYLSDIAKARSAADAFLAEIERTIRAISDDPSAMQRPQPVSVPTMTDRVREMLVDDMDLPQGSDAYHRLSGVVHTRPTAIAATWDSEMDRPSVSYGTFLGYLHLTLCSMDFSLENRAACWGENHKGAGLHKIIRRIERVIRGEPGVQFVPRDEAGITRPQSPPRSSSPSPS